METPLGSPAKSNVPTLTPTPNTARTIRGSPFNKSSPSKSPPKKLGDNIWDPDDDEFPDWPGTYKTAYGTFKPGKLPDLTALAIDSGQETPTLPNEADGDYDSDGDSDGDSDARYMGPTRTQSQLQQEERLRDTIAELCDPACGNALGSDMHDELMAEHKLFRNEHADLLSELPARYMHLVRWDMYANSRQHDDIVQYVRPRLCDAIATVLFEANPKCLDDFLNGDVRVFEWRHEFSQSSRQTCVLVRREGNSVMCGLYRNHGFHYLWYCLVKSRINFTGTCSEIFAACHGTTPVTDQGPAWDEFHSLNPDPDTSPDVLDRGYALFVGRQLACYLVGEDRRLWEYGGEWGEKLEWEADGSLTDLKMRGRSALSDAGEGLFGE